MICVAGCDIGNESRTWSGKSGCLRGGMGDVSRVAG